MHKLSVISILVLLSLAGLGLFIAVASNGNSSVLNSAPQNTPTSSSNPTPNSSPSNSGSLLSPSPPAHSSSSDDGSSEGGG